MYESDLSNTLFAEIPAGFAKELVKRKDVMYISAIPKYTTADCRPNKPCGGLPNPPVEIIPQDTNISTIVFGEISESGCSAINGETVKGSARKGALVGHLCKFNDEYYKINKDTICPEVVGFMKYVKTGQIFLFGNSRWQPKAQKNSWIQSSYDEYQKQKAN